MNSDKVQGKELELTT